MAFLLLTLDEAPSQKTTDTSLWIAKLGKFIGRKRDGEPGPLIMARGWQKFVHFVEAFKIMRDVHNS